MVSSGKKEKAVYLENVTIFFNETHIAYQFLKCAMCFAPPKCSSTRIYDRERGQKLAGFVDKRPLHFHSGHTANKRNRFESQVVGVTHDIVNES